MEKSVTTPGRQARPRRTPTPERLGDDQLFELARRYFLEDASKSDLARDFGISRFQVARLLKDAREAGWVTINIRHPAKLSPEMGLDVAAALGIERAIVVERPPGGEASAVEAIARRLSMVLAETLRPGQTLGLTWSRVVESMARQIERLPSCEVVQLAGAIHLTGNRLGSVETIRIIADVANGTAHPIYAPLVLNEPETVAALARQPDIARSLARGDELDVAVVSVGAWRTSGSVLHDLLAIEESRAMADMGACGEISGRLFDHRGAPIESDLDHRVLGITMSQLRKVPHVIGTSFGAYRANATIAAAQAGLFKTLIVDQGLAQAILDQGGLVSEDLSPP